MIRFRLGLGLYRMCYWVWVTGFGLDPNGQMGDRKKGNRI